MIICTQEAGNSSVAFSSTIKNNISVYHQLISFSQQIHTFDISTLHVKSGIASKIDNHKQEGIKYVETKQI